MELIKEIADKFELLKYAYCKADIDDMDLYKISEINDNDVKIMYEKGDISELEEALYELRYLDNELDIHRLSLLDFAREVFYKQQDITITNNYDDERKVLLTGQPVSKELKNVLAKLKDGVDVEIDEIEQTPELKLARTCINKSLDTIYLVGREDMRVNIVNNLMNRGSVSGIDENGNLTYNGNIENNSRLDIVIGLPASGKSSAIVNTLSTEYKSRIIDNDEAKKEIPEYNNGWGSGLVHSESQLIEWQMLNDSLKLKNNIVYPKVGSDFRKMMKVVALAKEYGYKVNVHYVELDRNVALGRMLDRFVEKGRFLDPKLIAKYDNTLEGNKIAKVYELLKTGGVIDGYSKWNNNVEIGKKPIMLETNCEGRIFNDGKTTNFDNRLRVDGEIRGGRLQSGELSTGSQRGDGAAVDKGEHEETGRGNVRSIVANTKKHKSR